MLALGTLGGHVYDKGAQPFQDFKLLIDLRNAIVHNKPRDTFLFTPDGEFMRVEPPPIVKRLEGKNILAEFEGPNCESWIDLISTQAVARWACNTSVEMVKSVMHAVPEGFFRRRLNFLYSECFQPVG
jgi:hypothetical protein